MFLFTYPTGKMSRADFFVMKSGYYECRRCPRGCGPSDTVSRLSWNRWDENEPSVVEKQM